MSNFFFEVLLTLSTTISSYCLSNVTNIVADFYPYCLFQYIINFLSHREPGGIVVVFEGGLEDRN